MSHNTAYRVGNVGGTDSYQSKYELKGIMHGESIKYDMLDLVDPIRLAAVGNRYPYHTSTQGVVLYKKRGSEHSFLMLHWSFLSSSCQVSGEGQLQRSMSIASLSQDPESMLMSCTEEEAFEFLYSLYGSNRNSDVTDEEIDQVMKIYLPNTSVPR
jgi:hypothetical protein